MQKIKQYNNVFSIYFLIGKTSNYLYTEGLSLSRTIFRLILLEVILNYRGNNYAFIPCVHSVHLFMVLLQCIVISGIIQFTDCIFMPGIITRYRVHFYFVLSFYCHVVIVTLPLSRHRHCHCVIFMSLPCRHVILTPSSHHSHIILVKTTSHHLQVMTTVRSGINYYRV